MDLIRVDKLSESKSVSSMNSFLKAAGLLLIVFGLPACEKGKEGTAKTGENSLEPIPALQPSQPIHLSEAAQKCCDALVASDFEAFVAYCHPRLVKVMGGKDAMINVLREGIGEGVTLASASAGEPSPVEDHGSWKIAILTQSIVLKVPGGRLASKSNLIAVSENGGSNWVFLDGSAYQNPQFAKLFPEIAGKLTLPEWGEPVFTPGI